MSASVADVDVYIFSGSTKLMQKFLRVESSDACKGEMIMKSSIMYPPVVFADAHQRKAGA